MAYVVIINDVKHTFRRSHKKLTCDDCSLRCLEMFPEHCKFKEVCKYFKDRWPTYEYGVFKKDKNDKK